MYRLLLGIPIAFALAGATAARADTSLLDGLDANGDGVVTLAEFNAARMRDFRLLDRNGNKVVSRREFYRRGRPEDRDLLSLRQRRYRLMDADDDGGITAAEYLAYGRRIFSRMDTNRDRRLAAGEVAAARGVQVASQDTSPGDANPTPAKATTPVPDTRDDNARALGDMPFSAVDANGDGYVSRGEYRHAVLTLFRRLDRNSNKVISRREYYWRGSVHDKVRLAARKGAYRRADDDDDGGLTVAEFTKMTGGLFARIDRNNEGRVSRAEWIAAFGPPSTTTAARTPKDTPDATPSKQAAQERLAMVRSLRDDRADRASKAPPAKPTTAKTAPVPTAPTEAPPAAKRPDDDKPDTALMAHLNRTKPTQAAETKPAPQVAARTPATEPKKPNSAPPTDPRLVAAFRSLDRDGDGKIAEIELAFARMARFAALDLNRDQILQPAEFVGKRGAPAAARFREMDRDGNGLVTWDEYKAAGNQRFLQLDTNRDKRLSLEEFSNAGRVNNSKVHFVKRVKIGASSKAKRVATEKQPTTPFEYETPSR